MNNSKLLHILGKGKLIKLDIEKIEELYLLREVLSERANGSTLAHNLMHRVNVVIEDYSPHKRPCSICGEPMTITKANKPRIYCSGRCRAVAHRRREKQRQQAIGTQRVAAIISDDNPSIEEFLIEIEHNDKTKKYSGIFDGIEYTIRVENDWYEGATLKATIDAVKLGLSS